jgi:hypothetical protein
MNAIATASMFQSPNLRRVRREEVAQPAFNKPDPYAQLMACWVDFMRVDDRDLGSRGMKLASDAEADRDVHTEQYLANIKIGEAVGAMVDSLTMQHRWAIYKSQRIATVWRFANADYEAVLLAARDELEQKLKKNVATRLYWA